MKLILVVMTLIFSIAQAENSDNSISTQSNINLNCSYDLVDRSWTVDSWTCRGQGGISCYNVYENSCNRETISIHQYCTDSAASCPR